MQQVFKDTKTHSAYLVPKRHERSPGLVAAVKALHADLKHPAKLPLKSINTLRRLIRRQLRLHVAIDGTEHNLTQCTAYRC